MKDDIVSSVAILEPEEDSEVVDISHNEVLDEVSLKIHQMMKISLITMMKK